MGNKIKKHPDAVAWDNWLESDEGKKCCEGETSGKYLENRLFRAFTAGRNRKDKKAH